MRAIFALIPALLLASLAALHAAEPVASPVVFWGPDSVEPGDVVLLYGGGLGDVKQVRVHSFPDGKEVAVPTLQARDESLKFALPASLVPGMFAVKVGAAQPWVLNRPEVWFMQPTTLLPGLQENEAAAGVAVQIVGKNFLLPQDKGTASVSLRGSDGKDLSLVVSKPEGFSLRAQLPANLPTGRMNLTWWSIPGPVSVF